MNFTFEQLSVAKHAYMELLTLATRTSHVITRNHDRFTNADIKRKLVTTSLNHSLNLPYTRAHPRAESGSTPYCLIGPYCVNVRVRVKEKRYNEMINPLTHQGSPPN